jgi:hypothetical protein
MVKLLELHYYYLKPLKDKLGEDWRPPRILYDFVRTVEPDHRLSAFMDLVGQAMEVRSDEFVGRIRDVHVQNIYSAPASDYLIFREDGGIELR